MKLKRGYVQVYTGDGKGKTTAALGLALRAAGAGLQVRIIQFMKGREYSEIEALKRFSDLIEIRQTGGVKCIRKEDVSDADRKEATKGLQAARQTLEEGDVDLLILDEILVARWFGLVSEEDILSLMEVKPVRMELVLTGRRATDKIIAAADLVTEMREVKHYYRKGVAARRGIES